jgi:hypothetical protein
LKQEGTLCIYWVRNELECKYLQVLYMELC